MTIYKNGRVFYCLILTLCISTLLIGCPLQGKGRAGPRPSSPFGTEQLPINGWRADAFPGLACPADNISLKWDVGDPFCRDTGPSCQTLSVTDSEGLLGAGYTSRELIGSYENGSVSSLDSWGGVGPTFTFAVTPDSPTALTWMDRQSQVQIVYDPPTGASDTYKVFSASCDGDLGWSLMQYRLDMTHEDFINATKGLGDCVRITAVCYSPTDPSAKRPDPVTVSLVGGSMPSVTLAAGECVEGLNLPPNLAYDVQPDPRTTFVRHEGNCVPGRADRPYTEPPFTQLVFRFSCDTTSEECVN